MPCFRFVLRICIYMYIVHVVMYLKLPACCELNLLQSVVPANFGSTVVHHCWTWTIFCGYYNTKTGGSLFKKYCLTSLWDQLNSVTVLKVEKLLSEVNPCWCFKFLPCLLLLCLLSILPADVFASLVKDDPSQYRPSYSTPGQSPPHQNNVLWNAMIHPLINLTIKGALWYQGGTWHCVIQCLIQCATIFESNFNMLSFCVCIACNIMEKTWICVALHITVVHKYENVYVFWPEPVQGTNVSL